MKMRDAHWLGSVARITRVRLNRHQECGMRLKRFGGLRERTTKSAAYVRMQNALKRRTKRGQRPQSGHVRTCQDGSILAR